MLALFFSGASQANPRPEVPVARNAASFTLTFSLSDYNGFAVSCNGATDASVDMEITGGALPFNILWSNGETTEDISSIGAGIYVVTVIDAAQDTVVDSVEVIQPLPININVVSVSNVSCFSFGDGEISLEIFGGLAPYSFSWSNGEISEDIDSLGPGAYTLNLTDVNNCPAQIDTVILEPEEIRPNFVVNDAIGAANGEILCSPTGGTGGYSYLWSTSDVTSSLSGLLPGPFTVTITDNSGCSIVADTVVQNALGACQIITDSVFNVSCNGGNDGAIYIDVFAAIPVVLYQWSNGAITQDVTNLVAGTYTVTITDLTLCTATQSFVITEPDLLELAITQQEATCAAANGELNTTFTGGTGPVTYLWSDGSTNASLTNLLAGNYTCTITDSLGCTDVETIQLNAIDPPQIIVDSVQNVLCNGGSTGAIFISVQDGTAPIDYLWSNGAIVDDINGLQAGTYTVTVTDADLCTATLPVTITEPLALNDSVQITNAACGLNNGSITVFPYDGTSPYSYLWSNTQTTATISSLTAGTYTVTITDANLCTRQRTATVLNSGSPVIAVDSVSAVRCNGGATGGVFISASGGVTPYTYLWSNGAITQDISNVVAGTYTVTVTDASLCSSTQSAIVTQPVALNDSVQVTNATCGLNNGSITVFPYNGTSPYTYLWSNTQTTATISSLAAGSYTVTITDANLCTRQRTSTIINTGSPVIAVDSVRAVRCNSGATGGVFISASGGVSPYTYIWSNGAITQDISNVVAGTYTVTVRDANLCSSTQSAIVTQPVALNDSVQVTNATCGLNNGSITVFPYNGTSPYTYLWSNTQTTATISSLAAGSYTVTITDANLCTRQRTSTVLNTGSPVIAVDSVRAVRCNGGATGGVFISASGGVTPYTYLWSNGAVTQDINNVVAGTYTVTVRDANLCSSTQSAIVTQPVALNDSVQVTNATCGLNNGSITVFPYNGTSPYTYLWSNTQTTATISSLAAGSYTVTITDANLCTRQRTSTVLNTGSPVIAVDSVRAARCNGGATGGVFISASGGVSPYTYLWSNGAVTQDISNVVAGTYTVTVRDANLCSSTQSAIVTQPVALNDSVQITNATCGSTNGSITTFPYGGTSPYTYLWNTAQTTQTISGLSAAVYSVTVTDANLCTKQRSVNVSNIGAPVIVADSVRNARCSGTATGGVFISVSGGLSPYTYLWSNGAITQDINNVIAGTYTVTITDFSSCQAIFDTVITQPAVLTDSVQFSPATCGLVNGTATVFPYGGTSPYTFLWSNGATTQSINSLTPGGYSVTIRDANLCVKTRSVNIANATGPTVVVDSTRNVSCFGGTNGAVYITISGGTAPRTTLWSNGSLSNDLLNVAAGIYTITVTDANACTATASGTVTQPAAVNDSVQVVNATCGQNNGSVSVFPFGGTSPYTYLWNTGATTSTLSSLASGNYTVTIRDANLCSKIRTTTVAAIGLPVAVIDSVRNVNCNGNATGAVYISVNGGLSPFTYLWSNGAITQDITNLVAGNYTVTVTDANLCTAVVDSTVSQPSALLAPVSTNSATCGLANGSATVTPSGGAGTYTYLWSNGQTTATINSLAAGSYTVTVRDANLCTKTAVAVVGNIGGPVGVIDSVRNVRCNGASTGAIFISVSGSATPFSYQWSNGALTQDLLNVIAGTYTVTITDTNSCSATLSATIGQSPLLNDSIQVASANCGAPTGNATVFPYGGTSPYTVLWSNGQTTNTIFNLVAGTYTVTITDGFGCTKVDFANISSTGGPVVAVDSIRNVRCFGGTTGGIFITVNGGTLPYTYLWSNGALTQDLTNVGAGSYTVTITDFNNCIVIFSGTITQPTQLQDSMVVTNATCGLSNGAITTVAFGGTTPYTYLWNTGASTATISNLAAGTYTVTVTDNNGCTLVNTATVSGVGGPTAVIDSVDNVSCFGLNDGAIYITPSGGTIPYTYLWTGGAITQDLTNVLSGTYTVTVRDFNNCTTTLSGIISQPAVLNDSASVTPEACGSATGEITVYPFGGTAPYDVLWNTGDITTTISGLTSGTYTVTITDFNNCTKVSSYVVALSGSPQITLDSLVNASCNGLSDGGIYVSVNGGTIPYTYLWSNGQITQDISSLQAGNYSLIVADNFVCRDTSFFTITEPDVLQDSLNYNPATCNLANGSAKVYPYGGTPGYTYQWSNGQTNQTAVGLAPGLYIVTVTDDNSCTLIDSVSITAVAAQVIQIDSVFDVSCNGLADGSVYITVNGSAPAYTYLWSNGAVTEDVTGLGPGNYTVTVTAAGCSVIQSFVIAEPDLLVNDSTVVVDAFCSQSNGSVTVYPSGGIAPYSYLWSDGQLTQTASSLNSGTYTVTISDFNGCSIAVSGIVNDIGGPTAVVDSVVDVKCFGAATGAIYITLTGGTTPYTYQWSNGAITEDVTGLIAGSYSVTITDSGLCQQNQSFVIIEPTALADSATVVDATCGGSNGAITIYPYGGTPGYSYLWNTGASTQTINTLSANSYTVTITDLNGCIKNATYTVNNIGGPIIAVDSVVNVKCFGASTGGIYITVTGGALPYTYLWSNLVQVQDLTGVVAGAYTVTVTDQNSCTATYSNTLTQPTDITSSFVVNDATCNGNNGSITTTINGGVPGYDFLWSTGAITPNIGGLAAGVYTLTVTDANGCDKVFSPTISNISAPEITVIDSGSVTCAGANDGFIIVNVSGGTFPYTYGWSNTSQTGNQITNLPGDLTYTLTITDATGCVAIQSVYIDEPDPISINAFVPVLNGTFNLTCNGSNDGSIQVLPSGGTQPYTYLWSNFAQSDSIGSLAAGIYTVTVTDAQGCTGSATYTLTQPPLLISNAGPNKVICGINSDTLAANPPALGSGYWLIVSGSATFADSTQANTVVTNLANGANVFQWVVTDGICSAFSQVVISYNTQIQAIAGVNRDICADSVLLNATAPQFGFGYWQIVNSDATIADSTSAVTIATGLNPGPNVFKWIVVNGTCSDSADLVIFVNDPSECIETLELPNGFTPNGDGKNDYFFVKGLDDYPDNSIVVYNRWGNQVWEKSGYRNDWDGVNDKGEPLAAGTYFVIFKVRSINRIITTYVDIRR
jgi:gliding motility-associated-like protein